MHSHLREHGSADARDHELVVHDLEDGIYRVTAVHTDGVVRATYGGHEVGIDLDALFD